MKEKLECQKVEVADPVFSESQNSFEIIMLVDNEIALVLCIGCELSMPSSMFDQAGEYVVVSNRAALHTASDRVSLRTLVEKREKRSPPRMKLVDFRKKENPHPPLSRDLSYTHSPPLSVELLPADPKLFLTVFPFSIRLRPLSSPISSRASTNSKDWQIVAKFFSRFHSPNPAPLFFFARNGDIG